MQHKKTVVHVTDKVLFPANQVSAFLNGLHGSQAYYETVQRSIVISPMNALSRTLSDSAFMDLDIQYSGIDGIQKHAMSNRFASVEKKFDVKIIYGVRSFSQEAEQAVAEYIFIDTEKANIHPVNGLKAWMFDEFGLQSDKYEHIEDYEIYCRLAPTALAVLRELDASDPGRPTVVISHGSAGVPTMLAAMMDPLGAYKTVLFAHEVPTVRNIIEHHPGHDCAYYNAVKWARHNHYYLSEIFGSQDHNFEHALYVSALHCDNIMALSASVRNDLHFLSPNYNMAKIDVGYPLPSFTDITFEEKSASREKLRDMTESVLGYRPDNVFSRQTDMSTCDAVWRDLHVLYRLEEEFKTAGRTGVYFLVNCKPPSEEVVTSKTRQGVRNRRQLQHGNNEIAFFNYIQELNSRNQHIKAIMVDERGWKEHAHLCRIPEGMSLQDLRQGSDLEFHLHAYDAASPKAMEALAAGSICVLNRICGGNDLIESLAFPKPDNVVVCDYTAVNVPLLTRESIMSVKKVFRDQVEERVCGDLVETIMRRLPQDQSQREKLFEQGRRLAEQMHPDRICPKYIIPAIDRAYHKRRIRQIA